MLHLHNHAESFYTHFFNLLYNYNLRNLNKSSQNIEAIDLIDENNKIAIQVSSTSTKQKIETALSKDLLSDYSDYTFKFISISKDATNLRKKNYKNKFGITFNPKTDIIDISFLLKEIKDLDIDKQKEVYEFIRKELGNENDEEINHNLFKLIKFDNLDTEYLNALSCSGLGENDVEACPCDSDLILDIKKKIDLSNKFVIKGETGSGKSLLTFQVAKKYHDENWQVYKLYKDNLSEKEKFTYPSEKCFIIVDDAQTINQSLFEQIADYSNKNCLILFNWNMSTNTANDNFLYSYLNISVDLKKQVELLKKFCLKNKDLISKKLKSLDIDVKPYDHFTSIDNRIERASSQKTLWEFNYVLTEGWNAVSHDMKVLNNKDRLDLGLVVIAIFQFITLDTGISKDILIDKLKAYTNKKIWFDNFNKILNDKDYCNFTDGVIKLKHYMYAKEVLHYFIDNNKDENINDFIEELFIKILTDSTYEMGYSNILEFVLFDYKILHYKLNKKNFTLEMLTNLFDNSNSSDEIKIKNLYSLIRFSDENHSVLKNNIEIIYKWIENVNRKTAYPLAWLINELYNEKFELNITENIMASIFKKISNSKLTEKSMYSNLYNRLNMFAKLKFIPENQFKINLANIDIGIEHYHFAKVISDLSYIDTKWTNKCIKDNINFVATTLNNNLIEAIEYYHEIFDNTFGLTHKILGISNKSNQYAKVLANLIEVDKVLEAFSKLSYKDTQRFSHFLLFLKIYNKAKLDEISEKADYEYLKELFKDDFLDIHEHKVIVHVLYNENSKSYMKYVNYLINNCKTLNKKLLGLNPELSLKNLKEGKEYKMNFHGIEEYDFKMKFIKWLDEEKEHELLLKILEFNVNEIKNCILNNISNVDNSQSKYDMLIYIYKNIPMLYENILDDKDKVNKHIQKIYTLLRGKQKEKQIAKLYVYLIKEFTHEHKEELSKLENSFPSIKNTISQNPELKNETQFKNSISSL
jgi:hypothetical protein